MLFLQHAERAEFGLIRDVAIFPDFYFVRKKIAQCP
jgi:hypothetical protein